MAAQRSKTRKAASILLLSGLLAYLPARAAFAVFTVPQEERVNEKEGVDAGKIYNKYAPSSLKARTPEEKIMFFDGQDASCLAKGIPSPSLKRAQYLTLKRSAEEVRNTPAVSSQSFLYIFGLFSVFVVSLTICVLKKMPPAGEMR